MASLEVFRRLVFVWLNTKYYRFVMPRSILAAGFMLSACLLACTEDSTQLLVVVDSDMTVPDTLVGVRGKVRTLENEILASVDFDLVNSERLAGQTQFTLPLSFGVLKPDSIDVDRVIVDVNALGVTDNNERYTLFARRAITGFAEGKSLRLPMFLASQCQALDCAEGETCTERGCVSAEVDENRLPETRGNDSDLVIPGPPSLDAGTVSSDASVSTDMGLATGADAGLNGDTGVLAPDSGATRDAGPVDTGPAPVTSACPVSNTYTPITDDGYDGTLGSMACVSMNVNATGALRTIAVELSATHERVIQLTLKLRNPSGTIVTLVSLPGCEERSDDGTARCSGTNSDQSMSFEPRWPIRFDDTASNNAEEMQRFGDWGGVICKDMSVCEFYSDNGSATTGTLRNLIGAPITGTWTFCAGDSESYAFEAGGGINTVKLDINGGCP